MGFFVVKEILYINDNTVMRECGSTNCRYLHHHERFNLRH